MTYFKKEIFIERISRFSTLCFGSVEIQNLLSHAKYFVKSKLQIPIDFKYDRRGRASELVIGLVLMSIECDKCEIFLHGKLHWEVSAISISLMDNTTFS